MSKLDQYITFAHVADQNSFSAAAKKLHVTPSAISQKISNLESQIKLTLIKRSSHGVTLTESGRSIYDGCKKIMREIKEVESIIQKTKSLSAGDIHITTPLGFLIIPLLKQFNNKYPEIRVHLDYSDKIPNFNNDESDLLFGVQNELSLFYSPDTVKRKICSSSIVYCAADSYLQKFGYPESPDMLFTSGHRFITHEQLPMAEWIEFANDERYKVNPYLTMNSNQALLQAAIEGLGIIKIPKYAAYNAIQRQNLSVLFGDRPAIPTDLVLFYPYARNIKPALRCFIDYMVNELKQHHLFKS